MSGGAVLCKQVLGADGAKGSSTQDNDVEHASVLGYETNQYLLRLRPSRCRRSDPKRLW
jgi:hypothetical protein